MNVPLTVKETEKLAGERNASFGCFGIALVFFLVLASVFVVLISNLFSGVTRPILVSLFLIIPVGFFVVYGLIKSFKSGIKSYSDLKQGQKCVVTAPVEGKRVEFKRNKGKAKRYRHFFLRAGGYTVRVSKSLYDEIKEGDLIHFEIAPQSEIIFSEPQKL